MDKDQILNKIFNDDPLGLLNVNVKHANVRTPDERLLASFQEINHFIEKNGKEPEANATSVSEFQLYSRLKSLKADQMKVEMLKEKDIYNVLPEFETNQSNDSGIEYKKPPKELKSIDDIFDDDIFDILDGDDAELFKFKHTPKEDERASADFVARRKPCKDFDKYEATFKEVQQDLANGKRKLIPFKQGILREGEFYVHNGILFLLEEINISQKEHYRPDGTRVREDGRTRCIFENGTESNMLKRSVEKILYANGYGLTQNVDKVNEKYIEEFSSITDSDEEVGYIYVLKSKSADSRITSIKDLYKIGYAKNINERLKGAEKQPTYLMASVDYVAGWKCYNMNPQKFEQLIHNFFGSSCLEIDVFDARGRRHTPREWFIAPIEVIEQAIHLIINGKITKYKYDPENKTIVER